LLAALAAQEGARSAAATVVAVAVLVVALVLVLPHPERGVLLILLVLPLDVAGRLLTEPLSITVFHVSLLLTLVAWAIAWLRDPETSAPRLSALDVGIAALVAAAVWSLPGSLDKAATVVSIVRLVFLWLFTLSVVTFVRDERMADRVVSVVVGTGAASSMLALVQYAVPGFPIGSTHVDVAAGGVSRARPGAFFEDPNLLGTFLSVAVIAALAKAVHARRWRDAAVWVALAGVCGLGLGVTLSRTGMVGVLLGVVVLVMTAPRKRRPWLAGAAVACAAVILLAAPGQVLDRLTSVVDIEADSSIRTRYLMVGSTVDMIRDRWVFGTGLGAYSLAYPKYRRIGALISITRPHQLPLALWAEMGIMGLVSEILIVGSIVWVVRSRRHRGWNVYESLGVAGLLAVLVQSLFQYYLYFEYLWLFLALTVAATRFTRDAEEVHV
ncbi:MAG: O-antigen ligase family protein, partial [Coriobacteriales bacterium]